jgi:glycosyltransferase involved in cell wall biosynthesis
MVELVGQLTGDAKWDAYFEADVFFFPTHYESEATPIVLMEALGAGLPIVSTQWAGIPAMLEGCDTAFLYPAKSPLAFAEALVSLLQRRERLPQMAHTSREFYESRFLPERFIERVADAFHMAMNQVGTQAEATTVIDRRYSEGALAEVSVVTDRRCNTEAPVIHITAYLADQNPGHDRSFGISRMSQVVLDALSATGQVKVDAITSETSQQPPDSVQSVKVLPWGTRRKWVRLLTDHLHPLFHRRSEQPDLYYFPKGYLPWLSVYCRPSVVTIHDTIIQYDEDHYPEWRSRWEYGYWAKVLKHTLRHADRILTV